MPRRRHLKRYRQILNTLARHGFGYLFSQLGLREFPGLGARAGKKPPLTRGARLRLALEELGPTFIKLGQVFSTRQDLLPRDIIEELRKLQDQVPPFPFEQVERLLEGELGQPAAEVFPFLEREALAAASIGQVHRARLADGREVAVKVQRPGVEQLVETDLEILFELARLAQNHTSWGQLYNFQEIAEEFARTLREELDYSAEGRNADRFRQNFRDEGYASFPEIYWEFTTRRVLTAQFLSGVKLNDLPEVERQGLSRQEIARNLAKAIFKQVLLDGFFHADPHPGNLLALEGNRIGFLDLGMVGRLSEERQEQFIQLVLGLARRNSRQITRTILSMGIVGRRIEVAELNRDVERLRERYSQVPFKQIRFGEAISQILDLAFKYKLHTPTEFTLLAKSLLTLEGVAGELDPELNLVSLAQPLALELMGRRLKPSALARRFSGQVGDYAPLLLEIPKRIGQLLEKAAGGEFSLRLEHVGLEETTGSLTRVGNRLSFSIVLLAFSIIMAGLVIGTAIRAGPGGYLLWRLPVLEVGFLVATLMFTWLIFSIFRSGRF